MSAAIYQRTRPIHWDEVVGQEHVKDVLRPALERGRIGHAYLFSGPRGVGKTTTARLIAMTVNCDDHSGAVKPCGKCESCKMVMSGRHPDVLEIDAASNNSVDDVRDLREKVALQPMRGDKKVYILDEAHMMSKSAFNALLKTLEEPPSHAVFILATTEPERLPPTILSRCQHYRFRRLSVAEIAGKLQKTCVAEGVTAAPEALQLMARSADGAMRDGESLLERMLAGGEPALTLSLVEGALGLPPQDRLKTLGLALAKGDGAAVFSGLGALYSDGFAPRTITERTKIALRDALHEQLNVDGSRSKGQNEDQTFDAALLLKLIRALDDEDARFARASDLIALEMAFTKALTVAQGLETSGGVGEALGVRVAALERQLREGGGAAPRAAVRPNVPDFDPTSRARPIAVKVTAPEIAVPDDDDREPSPNRAFVQGLESRSLESRSAAPASAPVSSSAPRAAGGKTWGDVVLKAKPQLKAFLMPAKVEVANGLVSIRYVDAKNNFHATSVAAKLEDIAALVREVMGSQVDVELVMPDGSKKNPLSNPRSAPVAPSVAVAPRAVRVEVAQVIEAMRETVPEILSVSPRANVIGAVIERGATLEPDALAFSQLGIAAPEPSLFAVPVEVVALEGDATPSLEGEEVLESPPLEFAPLEPAQTLKAPPEMFDDAPLPLDAYGDIAPDVNLETFDLSNAPDNVPLEAFALDFGDVSAPPRPRGPQAPSSLTGHPNYLALSKLFAHRVIGAGVFEIKAVATDEALPATTASEDTE